METKQSDTVNDNSFGQRKYSSNVLQGITSKPSTGFGGYVSKYNLQRCRLCVVRFPHTLLISIFDNQRLNGYLKTIEMYLPVKMHKNDGLPHYICCTCVGRLEECYELLQKFHRAYDTFRNNTKLTDEQTTSMSSVTVSTQTESSELSNNNAINVQNVNKTEVALQYKCSVCFKLFESQNDLNSHSFIEHQLLREEVIVSTTDESQAKTFVKKAAVNNDVKQCKKKDENIQNRTQVLKGIAGSTDSEINKFSFESSKSSSLKSTKVETGLVKDTSLSRAGLNVPKIRPKKISELTYSKDQHGNNSATFTVNFGIKENTSKGAAPLKELTNNYKIVSSDKIKVIYSYECLHCHRLLNNKKLLIEHCIDNHNMTENEKVICKQLQTIVTENGVEEEGKNLMTNGENVETNSQYGYKCAQCSIQLPAKEDIISHCLVNKCVNAKKQILYQKVKLKQPATLRNASVTEPGKNLMTNGENVETNSQYGYKCGQCSIQLPAKEDIISHCLVNKCVNEQNQILYQKVKLKQPATVRNASVTEHRDRKIHTLGSYVEQIRAKETNRVTADDKNMVDSQSKQIRAKETNRIIAEDKIPKLSAGKSNNSCLCMYCGAIRTKNCLLDHERIHTNERPYKCAGCPKTFRTTTARSNHSQIHDKNRNYICHQCGRVCNTQKRLSAHMKTHTAPAKRPFACEVCGKRFMWNYDYKRHKTSHTQIVDKSTHTQQENNKCTICNKVLKNDVYLNLHIKRAHVNKAQYSCHECGKTFKTKTRYTVHRNWHTGEKPYKCHICDKAFRGPTTRRQHMLVHQSEAPYICDICGKRFKRPGHVTQHKQCHTSDKPYSCHECGKTFKTKTRYTVHRYWHTGEKPFKCNICGKAFRSPATRRQHVLIHQSESPYYMCDICGQRFKHPRHLIQHQKVHNEVEEQTAVIESDKAVDMLLQI